MAEERNGKTTFAGVLISKQAQHEIVALHSGSQLSAFREALEEKAAGFLPHSLQETGERRVTQRAVSRGALVARRELAEARVQLKVAKVSDGDHQAAPRLAQRRREFFRMHEFNVRT